MIRRRIIPAKNTPTKISGEECSANPLLALFERKNLKNLASLKMLIHKFCSIFGSNWQITSLTIVIDQNLALVPTSGHARKEKI
jgi:hypothetical protein